MRNELILDHRIALDSHSIRFHLTERRGRTDRFGRKDVRIRSLNDDMNPGGG